MLIQVPGQKYSNATPKLALTNFNQIQVIGLNLKWRSCTYNWLDSRTDPLAWSMWEMTAVESLSLYSVWEISSLTHNCCHVTMSKLLLCTTIIIAAFITDTSHELYFLYRHCIQFQFIIHKSFGQSEDNTHLLLCNESQFSYQSVHGVLKPSSDFTMCKW